MALWDRATWKQITANYNKNGMMFSPIRGLIIHITDGKAPKAGTAKIPPTLDGVWGTFCNPAQGASAHFCVDKEGSIMQFVDTDNRAWSVDGDTIDSHWISIENIAVPGETLTEAQQEVCADLLLWLQDLYNVPLTVASAKDGWGLGYHSMFKKGDHACPGAPVVAQLADIVALAKGVEV